MSSLVSIILPTFNRARFLPEALSSIQAQVLGDWELIVVDDGSTDGTRELIEREAAKQSQPLRYVHQQNQGAYAARNTGLDHARGDYIAFFDSDDLWLPEYLDRLVGALDNDTELDWIYSACRMIDDVSGATIAPSTFYVDGTPREFLRQPATSERGVHRLDSGIALLTQLRSGLYAGLQNSVIRRRVFAGTRFWPDYRVVEDVLFLVRALSRGVRIAYVDLPLVIYRVHDDNSSASVANGTPARLLPIFQEEVRGLERLKAEVDLPDESRAVLDQQLGSKYFWRLGYAGYWQSGRRAEALAAFRSGLRLSGFDWRMWKTYMLCRLRTLRP